jgi:hypothetical protein
MTATTFKPGQSGNPAGKPRGSRNRTTLAVEALLDGEAETLTRKAIELAKAGDLAALRTQCANHINGLAAPYLARMARHDSQSMPGEAASVCRMPLVASLGRRGVSANQIGRQPHDFRAAKAASGLQNF